MSETHAFKYAQGESTMRDAPTKVVACARLSGCLPSKNNLAILELVIHSMDSDVHCGLALRREAAGYHSRGLSQETNKRLAAKPKDSYTKALMWPAAAQVHA